jgi:multisubunit Na+/H+ antiporter MnhC subunit
MNKFVSLSMKIIDQVIITISQDVYLMLKREIIRKITAIILTKHSSMREI